MANQRIVIKINSIKCKLKMSLNYKILEKKPYVSRGDETFMDLLVQTINPDTYVSGSLLIVNEHYVARPDLISLAMYGDEKYADVICKINGISNPFELNENDVLIIPHIETINDMLETVPEKSIFITGRNGARTRFMDTYDETKLQKNVNDRRSPNEQVKGQKNLIVDEENGLLIY